MGGIVLPVAHACLLHPCETPAFHHEAMEVSSHRPHHGLGWGVRSCTPGGLGCHAHEVAEHHPNEGFHIVELWHGVLRG